MTRRRKATSPQLAAGQQSGSNQLVWLWVIGRGSPSSPSFLKDGLQQSFAREFSPLYCGGANPQFTKSLLINRNTPILKNRDSDGRGSWTPPPPHPQIQKVKFLCFCGHVSLCLDIVVLYENLMSPESEYASFFGLLVWSSLTCLVESFLLCI